MNERKPNMQMCFLKREGESPDPCDPCGQRCGPHIANRDWDSEQETDSIPGHTVLRTHASLRTSPTF